MEGVGWLQPMAMPSLRPQGLAEDGDCIEWPGGCEEVDEIVEAAALLAHHCGEVQCKKLL